LREDKTEEVALAEDPDTQKELAADELTTQEEQISEEPDTQVEQTTDELVTTQQDKKEDSAQEKKTPPPPPPPGFIKNRAAFLSLAAGLIGLMYYGLVFGAIAVALGFAGRKLKYQRGMATIGMVLGIIDVFGGFFSTIS